MPRLLLVAVVHGEHRAERQERAVASELRRVEARRAAAVEKQRVVATPVVEILVASEREALALLFAVFLNNATAIAVDAVIPYTFLNDSGCYFLNKGGMRFAGT